MALTSNLYPPLMPNVIPGFNRQEACKVYFSLSQYNSIDDIANIQLILTNIKTNKSALDTVKYPSGIKLIKNMSYDSTIQGDYKYYVIIYPADLVNSTFELNAYYKVQLRFTSTDAQYIDISGTQSITNWINNNLAYFSEWSKACILRGVSKPTLKIKPAGKSPEGNSQSYLQPTAKQDYNLWEAQPAQLIGDLTFKNTNEQDYLTSYRVKIFVSHKITNENEKVFDSGIVYSDQNTKNHFEYTMPYNFGNKQYYYFLFVTYCTKNLYEQTEIYTIKLQEDASTAKDFGLRISASINDACREYGYINLTMKMTKEQGRNALNANEGMIILRRASSKDGFSTWEDLYTFYYSFLEIHWRDITVENGIWYKYSLYCMLKNVEQTNNGVTTIVPVKTYAAIQTRPVCCIFDSAFLIKNNSIFKMTFDPNVTGFKYNVTESQQLTLGGKFPYVRRNAANYYRSFSVSGLISSLTNETWWWDPGVSANNNKNNHIHNYKNVDPGTIQAGPPEYVQFTSKEDLYKENLNILQDFMDDSEKITWNNEWWQGDTANDKTLFNLYNKLENKEGYSDYLNPLYERFFRQKFYEFIYDDGMVLFKSPTEGNILVKLTDINFEPVQTLGRVLYSFTATATEIDESTFANYLKYDVVVDKFLDIITHIHLNSWQPVNDIARINESGVQHYSTTVNGNTKTGYYLLLEEHYVKGGRIYDNS